MKEFFRRLFNLYSGEEKSALLFTGLGFLWSLGVTSGQKFADALFLLHVGSEFLPQAYAMTACLLMVMAIFFLKAFQTVNIQRIFAGVLLAGICFYTGAFVCSMWQLGMENKIFWYALKIFGSVFFVLIVTCFWTFIDQYFHLQDAKRLYSLFTSAIFLGVATTGILMRSGWLELHFLLIYIVVLLMLSIYWVRSITQQLKPIYDEDTLGMTEDNTLNLKRLLQTILASRFTLFLMAGNFLAYVLLVITEYSYLSAFDNYFAAGSRVITGEEGQASLTLFLGQLLAGVSIFNLVVGLFLYSRLIRRYGITTLVLFTPAVLVFTFSGWLVTPSLLFPVIGFFVVEGMLYIIDDNNFTLLLNAVPTKVKYQIRLIIESFFEPTGMLVSSFLISFVPINSKVLGLVLSICLLAIALLARKHYLKGLFINLAENTIHFQRSVRDWFFSLNKKARQATERRLLAFIQIGDEVSQLFAMETLISFEDRTIIPKVLERSEFLSTSAKVKFIDMMTKSRFATDTQFLELLHAWSANKPDLQLKRAIHFHLARHGLLHPDKVYYDLESTDLILKGAAIMALKKSWAHLPSSASTANRALAVQYIQQLLESQDEEEIVMGITILSVDAMPQDLDILIPFLKHPSQNISRSAARSIAQITDKHSIRYAATLLTKLESTSDSEVRQSCLRALGKMGSSSLTKEIIKRSIQFRPNERRLAEKVIARIGLRAVPMLLAITKDTSMHDRCRLLAGRVLGRLALPQLRSNLYSIVSVEIDRAYFYFYHYHALNTNLTASEEAPLKDALLSGYQSVLDFIIQILSIAGESEDCELLSRALRSPNPKVRSHVIETLEKTCENRIFRALYPLVADVPHAEKMQTYIKNGHTPLSLSELLDKMGQSSSLGDRIIAAAYKYRFDLPNWRDSLRQQMASNEEIFHHFAYELLET